MTTTKEEGKPRKKQTRFSGILAHPTSFPGAHGMGDLGDAAYRFIDFLAEAGQQFWQIMPLGPTGYGDSPYACFSAFAGNPYVVSLEALAELGLLDRAELDNCPAFPVERVDYGPVIEFRLAMLRKAFKAFADHPDAALKKELDTFTREHGWWLDDFARFMAYKDTHQGRIWSEWSAGKDNLSFTPPPEADEAVAFHKFVQFHFFTQWFRLKQYANERDIRIIGDVPIFVAYDSADVWAHPRLFHLDEDGHMTVVAGVPPDYFSTTGQLWGNPLYRWDVCRDEGFSWWLDRFRWTLKTVDVVRIDHFRGFRACWSVPAGSPTAEHGEWVKAPGKELFKAVRRELGEVPIIAEDLGEITKDVVKLRDEFGFPGMKILQFAFGGDDDNDFLPHNYSSNCVVYTGSHDNNTTRGWYDAADERVRDHVHRYLGRDGSDIAWDMIRAALASVAYLAVIPLQDVMNLGGEARMNYPGRPDGNWQWRYTTEMLNDFLAARLRELTGLYGRLGEVDRQG